MVKKVKYLTQIGFINPDTGHEDETEFDTSDSAEALNLFTNDFCKDNKWSTKPKILYITKVEDRECGR